MEVVFISESVMKENEFLDSIEIEFSEEDKKFKEILFEAFKEDEDFYISEEDAKVITEWVVKDAHMNRIMKAAKEKKDPLYKQMVALVVKIKKKRHDLKNVQKKDGWEKDSGYVALMKQKKALFEKIAKKYAEASFGKKAMEFIKAVGRLSHRGSPFDAAFNIMKDHEWEDKPSKKEVLKGDSGNYGADYA